MLQQDITHKYFKTYKFEKMLLMLVYAPKSK